MDFGFNLYFFSNKIRHFVLDILLSSFWDQLVIDQQLNQTLSISYFNESILGSISN